MAADEEEEWWDVAGVEEIPPDAPLAVQAHGYPVAVFAVEDEVCALWSRCPHKGGPLDEGYQKGEVVVCPWHGSMFRVTTGECLNGPADTDATVFPVEVEDGRVWIGPPPKGIDPPPPSFLQF